LKTLQLFFILLFSCFLFSCKKDNRNLSADVQPESDLLGTSFSNTTQVLATTVKHNRFISFNIDNNKFVGSVDDPIFGRTDVGLYLNASIPNGLTNVSFGQDPEIISSEIVLAVPSLDFIGNINTILSYSVHPITTALSTGSVYFSSNDSLHSKTSVLGSYTGTFSIMNGKLVLRIPIDNNYASAILNNPQYLLTNSVFQNTYKGFYITAAGSNLNPLNMQGYISKVNLADELSGFYLYYKTGSPSAVKENKSYKFVFAGADAVRFNHVKYNPTNVQNLDIKNQVTGVTTGTDRLYVKGLGGTRVKIDMPDLISFADSFPVAVNRAELILNVDPASLTVSNGLYKAPPKLTLFAIDSLGNENFTTDQLNSTDMARYGGDYDETNKRYVFNIARQVQAILRRKKKNYGFYLVVTNPDGLNAVRRDTYMERIVLFGTNTSKKPVFNLNYIKFKND
jgi:hypothetical protein